MASEEVHVASIDDLAGTAHDGRVIRSSSIVGNRYATPKVVRQMRELERANDSFFQYRSAMEEVKVARRSMTLEKAFWSRVHQPEEGCWDWMGARDRMGYGRVSHQSKSYATHRLSLEWKLGRPIAEGMMACHTCDHAPCVRPDHLYEGTATENQQDRYSHWLERREAGRSINFDLEPYESPGRGYGK